MAHSSRHRVRLRAVELPLPRLPLFLQAIAKRRGREHRVVVDPRRAPRNPGARGGVGHRGYRRISPPPTMASPLDRHHGIVPGRPVHETGSAGKRNCDSAHPGPLGYGQGARVEFGAVDYCAG